MDRATFGFYAANSAYCVERWAAIDDDSSIATLLTSALPAGDRVLDVGCGTGRDMAILSGQGFDVFGVEPVSEFRDHITTRHIVPDGRVADASLPDLTLPSAWPEQFDDSWDALLLERSEEAEP